MRLLELRGNSAPAPGKSAALLRKPTGKLAPADRALKRPVAAQVSPASARVFPINSPVVNSPLRKKPAIDLEQLQQRIDMLERRIHARLDKQGDPAQKQDIEQLRQRLKLLERKLESELWAAKQREYALLEILAKRTTSQNLKQRLMTFLRAAPSAIWKWIKSAGREWWTDSQPLWWSRFAAAWQEALYRAQR